MSQRNTVAHFLHDAGLAAWFGGSLMGDIGLNGAASTVDDPRQRTRVANAGWDRWTPVNAVAIGAHLFGAVQIARANKGRVAAQDGVLGNTIAKAGLTGGALAATAYARWLGRKISKAGDVPSEGATTPHAQTPPEVAKAQKQLALLQWAIPALTGAMLASSALHEEQQRPTQVAAGVLKRLPTLVAGASGVGAKAPRIGSKAAA
jgi:hypothetical protein